MSDCSLSVKFFPIYVFTNDISFDCQTDSCLVLDIACCPFIIILSFSDFNSKTNSAHEIGISENRDPSGTLAKLENWDLRKTGKPGPGTLPGP